MSTLHRDRAPDQSRQNFWQDPTELLHYFRAVRAKSCDLAAPLSDADATVQSMPDASPTKWHLAHASWFFEQLVLEPHAPDYRAFDPSYAFLFNSYYEALGSRQPRPLRGLITRPTLEEILAYRAHVDAGMENFWRRPPSARAMNLVELGCHHEQQHQELLLTDILHLFAQNPLGPVYRHDDVVNGSAPSPAGEVNHAGGLVEIGAAPEGFAFDCERPRHRVFIAPFRLADRLVSNAEWMDFVADGGYRRPAVAVGRLGAVLRRRMDGAQLLGKARRRLLDHDFFGPAAGRSGGAGGPCQLFRSRRFCALGQSPSADGKRVGACRRRAAAIGQHAGVRSALCRRQRR